MGEGQGSVPLQSPRHHLERGEVLSSTDSDINLSGNGDREPFFEGFSFPGEGFHPAHTDHQISVFQAAQHRVLVVSAGSSSRLFAI